MILKRHRKLFRRFTGVMSVRAWHFAAPLTLTLAAAGLDGVALALLVPLARGIAESDFQALWDLPGAGGVHEMLAAQAWFQAAPNRVTFLLIVGLIIGATLIRLSIQYVANVLVEYRQGIYTAKAKDYTFGRFMSFGKLYFDRTSQGRVNRILGYSELIPRILSIGFQTLNSAIRLMAHLVVMLTISLRLTSLTLLVLPIAYYTVKAISQNIRRLAKGVTEDELSLSRQAFNMFSSIPLIKTYSREAESRSLYRSYLERLRQLGLRQALWQRLIAPVQAGLLLVALSVVAVIGILSLPTDNVTQLSTFCAFLLIARQTLPLFSAMAEFPTSLAQLEPRLDRLAELFDDNGKFVVRGGDRSFRSPQHEIRLKGLSYAYETEPVLNRLSLTIPAAQTTAIVGPSGCGKTTLLSLLARLYECPPATILVDGVDIREFSLPTLHHEVAMVSQDIWLHNDTLRNNLCYGLKRDVTDRELIDKCNQAALGEWIQQLPHGLNTEIGDRGVRLSGGEKQRLSIARALLKDASIVILDEATSALDSPTEGAVYRNLKHLLARRTVIVIAHRLSTIRDADKIVVLDHGRRVEQGTWAQLIAKRGHFYALWQAQAEVKTTVA